VRTYRRSSAPAGETVETAEDISARTERLSQGAAQLEMKIDRFFMTVMET
jgi:hypothetical protein